MAGERFAPLNFKSLTEMRNFDAAASLCLSDQGELCDPPWVTFKGEHSHTGGGCSQYRSTPKGAAESAQHV